MLPLNPTTELDGVTVWKIRPVALFILESKIKMIRKADKKIKNFVNLEAFCYTPEEFEIKKKEFSVVREAIKEGIEI